MSAPRGGLEARAWDATFALYGTLGGESRLLCTATAYNKVPGGYQLASAGHCLEGAPKEVEFSVAEDIGSPLMSVKVVKARRDRSTNMDFAVFELPTDRKYPMVGMDLPMDAAVGDDVVVVHFSKQLGKQLGRTRIASRIVPEAGDCEICRDNFYLPGDGFGPGVSGAAVVSLRTGKMEGIVVGVADQTFVAEPIGRFPVFVLDKPEGEVVPF